MPPIDLARPRRLKRRRTKIVATLGPATGSPEVIERLVAAGVDLFRLNLSHGDHAAHEAAYRAVRTAAQRGPSRPAVLADLSGPKLRIGRLEGGRIELAEGQRVTVTTKQVVGGPGLIPSQYAGLADDVRPGSRILLADGLLELEVESVEGYEVGCTVVHGGILAERKGINLPNADLSTPCLTDKDRADARFALDLGVDYLAMSFVRRASDIKELRALFGPHDRARIVAKIERPEAIEDIDGILDEADAVMVARGDLGVELPPERVPVLQRALVARARAKAKPSIVATQMLESMTDSPQPTRAEVSDVSTAVFTGADAVMLSAETASGRYPVQAVEMMDRIAREVEAHLWSEGGFRFETEDRHDVPFPLLEFPLLEAVARSTAQLSRDLQVRGIVVFSKGGTTARVVSSLRPAAPVVTVTSSETIAVQANLLWGTVPYLVEEQELQRPNDLARHVATALGLVEPGHRILAVAGFGGDEASQAPSITVLTF